MISLRKLSPTFILTVIAALSLGLHVYLLNELNIIEDESGYMQDASQIQSDFLPFREFGGTKGPVFLFALKFWQTIFGNTLEASRFFSIFAHVTSIPLLFYFARNITRSTTVSYLAALLWATVPVTVSLTSNVTHIPLELAFVLGAAAILSRPSPYGHASVVAAATLFFTAVLTRASGISYLPVLLLLLVIRTRSWKSVFVFAGTGILLISATIAIIYPLYGWPKTAFFFNADATLIATKQRAVYAAAEQSLSVWESYFRAALPAWREGLAMMLAACLIPFVWIAQRSHWSVSLILFGILSFGMGPLILNDIADWWSLPKFESHWIIARATLLMTAFVGISLIIRAKLLNKIDTMIMLTLALWIGAFVLFYKGWGRSPTPFYVLESIPALSIAAALTITWVGQLFSSLTPSFRWLVSSACLAIFIFSSIGPYPAIPIKQYRGTTEVLAAKTMAKFIERNVPAQEPLFTAQPMYAYLSGHSLYGGYTHPGWYLSERAGYMPPEIRSVFLPDFDVLTDQVKEDVNWIVIDWRTQDVYFNENTELTKELRDMVASSFEAVISVPNETSTEITLYRRVAPSE